MSKTSIKEAGNTLFNGVKADVDAALDEGGEFAADARVLTHRLLAFRMQIALLKLAGEDVAEEEESAASTGASLRAAGVQEAVDKAQAVVYNAIKRAFKTALVFIA